MHHFIAKALQISLIAAPPPMTVSEREVCCFFTNITYVTFNSS